MVVVPKDLSEAPGRRWVLGIQFDMLDLDEVVQICAERDETARFAYISTPSAAYHARVFRAEADTVTALDNAWLLINDSRVVKRIAFLLFRDHLPLAAGSDLTKELFARVIRPDDRISVIGGDQALADALRARFGLLNLAQHVPPFGFAHNPAELARCIAFVRENPSRFVFIACGAPQSELLGAAIVRDGGARGLGLCIGASLQFEAGKKRRAPVVVQRLGLEWAFRILQEPRRMARRLWSGQLPLLRVALHYRLHGAPAVPLDGRRTTPVMVRR